MVAGALPDPHVLNVKRMHGPVPWPLGGVEARRTPVGRERPRTFPAVGGDGAGAWAETVTVAVVRAPRRSQEVMETDHERESRALCGDDERR